MKYVKLGYLMLIKNFGLNFVVIFQIVAMVLVGVNLTSMLSIQTRAAERIAPLTERNFVYYMSVDNFLNHIDFDAEHLSEADKTESEATDVLSNLTNVQFHSRIFQTDAILNGDPNAYAYVYACNQALLDVLDFPLKNGSWFGGTTKNGDVIDAVANANSAFKTGDIITLTVKTKGKEKVTFKVRIIGTLKNPAYMPSATHIGQALFSLSLAEEVTFQKTGLPTLLINANDLERIEHIFYNAPVNEYIVFNGDISEAEYRNNLQTLTSNGLVATAESIAAGDNEFISNTLRENLPMIIFLFVLSVTGLVSISVINMSNYLKTFAIYFICGCTWRECYKIIVSYLSMILFWASALTLLLTAIFMKTDFVLLAAIEINAYSVSWFVAVLLLYLGISLIVPAFVLKKSTPNAILSKTE